MGSRDKHVLWVNGVREGTRPSPTQVETQPTCAVARAVPSDHTCRHCESAMADEAISVCMRCHPTRLPRRPPPRRGGLLATARMGRLPRLCLRRLLILA